MSTPPRAPERVPYRLAGGILAGGLGRRMQGRDKGWVMLDGRPMVEHVLERLRPQVDALLINANRHEARYATLGYEVVPDTHEGFQGPLAGMEALLSALARDTRTQPDAHSHNTDAARFAGLITCPCDAPFLPDDLVARLTAHLQTSGTDVGAVATAGGRLQPVFAYLPLSRLPSLRAALAGGERKIDRWFASERFLEIPFDDLSGFRNINTLEDLQRHDTAAALGTPAATGAVRHTRFGAPVVGVSAPSGTGKTTFLCALLPRLKAAGLKVGVVKRAHHRVDVDKPGKDSYELRHAGSERVLLASRERWALMVETPSAGTATVGDLVARIESPELDLVLIEGFDLAGQPRVLLHRADVQPAIPARDTRPNAEDPAPDEHDLSFAIELDSEVLALFTDHPHAGFRAHSSEAPAETQADVARHDINDIDAATAFFLRLVQAPRHGNILG